MLTFISIEEIEEMERTLQGAALNKAKEILAFELTKLVHGEDEAIKADTAAKAIFQDEELATICRRPNLNVMIFPKGRSEY